MRLRLITLAVPLTGVLPAPLSGPVSVPLPSAPGAVPVPAAVERARSLQAVDTPPSPGARETRGDQTAGFRLARAARPDLLAAGLERAARLEPLRSLLISQGGRIAVERYWRGMVPDRPMNLKSASKSLLSALVGIAIREGHLEGVDQRVSELLPEYFDRAMDPRKREITLGHLLTMTSGLETTSFRNYGGWVSSRDWARDALARPLTCDPGRCWRYSTGNTHLLSVILTRATGKSTLAYAREKLFGPLGIRLGPWDRDPQGYYLGGNNMSLRPRELLAFGELYRNGGRHGGRQIVPWEWVVASWQPRVSSPWNGHGYGYLWWSEEWGGERAYFGWGYGGQYVVVVPSLELVVVMTSALSDRRRGHNRELRRLLDRYLIPAFRPPSEERILGPSERQPATRGER